MTALDKVLPDESTTAGAPPAEGSSQRVQLLVEGMTCGACSARVQRALTKLDGVQASVNFATGRALVDLPSSPASDGGGRRRTDEVGADPASVTTDDLVAAVERAGYSAHLVQRTPPPAAPPETRPGSSAVDRRLWGRLFTALVLFIPLGDLSLGTAFVPWLRFPGWRWVLLALAAPICTWCAWPFHRAAWSAARHRSTTMDTLVSVGVIAASVLSVSTLVRGGAALDADDAGSGWSILWHPTGAVYLDLVAGITLFVLIGRLLDAQARARAGSALHALAEVGVREVSVLEATGAEVSRPLDELGVGDLFVVRPGQVVATDGTVTEGRARIDASTMTGESLPVEVAAGSAVAGGTTSLDGRLVVRADAVGSDTQLSALVTMVESAQATKAAAQRLADRISAVFVPVVLGLAVATFAGWTLWGPSLALAVNAALSVVVVACPCALGLATPTALLAGTGRGAQLGIFLKGQQALEAARAIDTVVLDKTGTLTTGQMAVSARWAPATTAPAGGDGLVLAGAVEAASEHAIARALSGAARRARPVLPAVEDFRAHAGRGTSGRVEGHDVLVGSLGLIAHQHVPVPTDLRAWLAEQQAAARSTVVVAVDGQVAAAVALSDALKPSAPAAVRELHALGLRTVLLSGDNSTTAAAVADQLGIASEDVVAEVSPGDKAQVIAELRRQGRSVAMVGDGINDAPALAGADLGIAVVEGSDVARAAADVLLLRSDLSAVPQAVRLARATLRTIRGNLAWAFGYNVAVIPLAAAGLLNPMIAAGAMAASSLFVLSNSLRLQRFDAPRPGSGGPEHHLAQPASSTTHLEGDAGAADGPAAGLETRSGAVSAGPR